MGTPQSNTSEPTTYLFESEAAVELFVAIHPTEAKRATTPLRLAETFAGKGGVTPRETRLGALREILASEGGDAADAETTLETIDRLRLAMVLSREDVGYCFSEIPATPKNKRLRRVMERFLTSGSGNDPVGVAWVMIEALKEGAWSAPLGARVRLVPAARATRSLLFEELVRALAFGPHELVDAPEPAAASRYVGSASALLDRLARRALTLARRHRTVVIGFHGTEGERTLLASRLARLGVPNRSWIANESPPRPVPQDVAFQALIRQDKSRPLADRLRLCHEMRLAADPRAAGAPALRAAASESPMGPVPPGTAVIVPLPLTALPGSHATLAYWHPARRLVESDGDVLDVSEREALRRKGFPIPRAKSESSPEEALESLPRHAWVFTTERDGETAGARNPRVRFSPSRPARENAHVPRFAVSVEERFPLSASALETYARCPSQFFFSQLLRVRPHDPDRAYAATFGSAVHEALEQWKRNHGERTPEALREAFREALVVRSDTVPAGSPRYYMCLEQFEALVPNILACESALDTLFGDRHARALEASFKVECDDVALVGKLDRVEETKDGDVLVIDYKTGNVGFSPNQIHSGTHFQALLYLWGAERALGATAKGILFADLKRGEVRRGLLRAERLPKGNAKAFTRGHALGSAALDALEKTGKEHVLSVARRVFAGEYAPAPDAQICDICDYVGHCRSAKGRG